MSEKTQGAEPMEITQLHPPNGSFQGSPFPLEKMVLDSTQNRYQLVLQTIRWAKELRAREGIPTSLVKLLDRALEDLLTGRMTPETVQQMVAAEAPAASVAPAPAPDKPSLEKPAPAKAEKKTKKKAAMTKKKKR